MQKTLYVGLDVHKATLSITVAEEGRDGAVRFIGTIPNTPTDVAKLAHRLGKEGDRLEFCYEAGGCGYGIYRQLTALGHSCTVAAPTLIARKPGDRIKTDRRDYQKLALQHRSGDLTAVWVPDEVHEAMRDLVRARIDAVMQLMRARQQLLAFLLRHRRTYETGKNWTLRHRRWLASQAFEQEAHRITFQDYIEAVWAAQDRRDQLEAHIVAMLPNWSMAPLVGRRPAGVARARPDLVGDFHRCDRRSRPLRDPRPVDGLSRPGPLRAVERRTCPPRRHYEDRQSRSTAHARRSRLELSLSGSCLDGKDGRGCASAKAGT